MDSEQVGLDEVKFSLSEPNCQVTLRTYKEGLVFSTRFNIHTLFPLLCQGLDLP